MLRVGAHHVEGRCEYVEEGVAGPELPERISGAPYREAPAPLSVRVRFRYTNRVALALMTWPGT